MTGEIQITVKRIHKFETDRALKAFADIVINNAVLIKGIKVLKGDDGLFVAMPQEQGKDNKWYESVRCLSREIKKELEAQVLLAYGQQ